MSLQSDAQFQETFDTYPTAVKQSRLFFPPEPASALQMVHCLESKLKPKGTAISYHQCNANVKIMNIHKGMKVEVKLVIFNPWSGQKPPLSNINSSL